MKSKMIQSFLLKKKKMMNVCMADLLKMYGAYIRAKVIGAVSNEAEREELMAEIIVHLYEKLSKMVYTEEGRFKYWLHTVVNNYIVSWIRTKSRRRIPISDIGIERIPSVSPSIGDTLHREKIYSVLWEIVGSLENSQREMLLLHFQQGVRLTELAEMKGIPYNTFYKQFKKTLLMMEHLCNERGVTVEEYIWLQSHNF